MIKVTPDAIAQSKAGKLQGANIDGIYRFLGIRYCEPPVGQNRFMPPKPITPWEGVKPALEYAAKCWQCDEPRMEDDDIRCTRYPSAYEYLMTGSSEMGVGYQSEDCCALNLWTQGVKDGKKRPVLVWFHGGGNIAGAAEADWHDGYNLAKNEDIIFVTVGHRLGIFGYLYLCDLDEKYKDSANLGHQDMIAALKWINENIEEFGGDPNNVTICGQSGGGGKVCALIGSPMARPYINKAIIQSGGFHWNPISRGQAVAKDFLDYLGIDKNNLDKLYDYSGEDLIRLQRELNKTRTMGTYFQCGTVLDGKVMKYNPFDGAEGSEFVKDMPIISGYDGDDLVLFAMFDPPMFKWTEEQVAEGIQKLGYSAEDAQDIIKTYKNILGEDVKPVHIYTTFINDRGPGADSHKRMQSREAVGGKAPFYNYCFNRWGNDDEFRAVHGVEIPFFFGNADYARGLWNCDTHADAMKVNEACRSAWGAFCRTGDPSNPHMPRWLPMNSDTRYTMVVDVESELKSCFRKELYKYMFSEGTTSHKDALH